MMAVEEREALGKTLAYILRHVPEDYGVTLDGEGWAPVAQVLAGMGISKAKLDEILAFDSKQRYRYSEDGERVRALQGHSTKGVQVAFEELTPPASLFHGTPAFKWRKIQKSTGLQAMARHHVHLSADKATAKLVAARWKAGKSICLRVDAVTMAAEGYKFFKSENGVWLVAEVPLRFITVDFFEGD